MANISYDDLPLEKVIHQKEIILEELKKNGCRITKQRKLIINTILNNEFSCCKEIYWEAIKSDSSIGIATVYRVVNTLEDIGAINRKNLYKISCNGAQDMHSGCTVYMKNNKKIQLSAEEWAKVIMIGLKDIKGLEHKDIDSIVLKK